MSTTYSYVIRVDSQGIPEIIRDLKALGDAADAVGKPVTKLPKDLDNTTASVKKVTNAGNDLVKTFRTGSTELDRTSRAMRDVTPAADKAAKSIRDVSSAGDMVKNAMSTLKGVFAGVIASLGVSELIKTADTYTNLQSKLAIVTKNANELAAANENLLRIANKTQQPLEATVNSYATLARATKELKPTQEQIFKATENLNKVFRVAGTEAETAKAAIIQLGQGLGAGALRGEEFNSVMEATNGVFAELLAKKLNVKVGELRALAEQGRITSKVVFEALSTLPADIENAYGKMAQTIGGAFTVLNNNFLVFLGSSNGVQIVMSALAQTILLVANNLNVMAAVLAVVATRFAAGYIVAFASALMQAGTAAGILNVVLGANPIVRIVTAIATGIAILVTFGDQLGISSEQVGMFTAKAQEMGAIVVPVITQIVGLGVELYKSYVAFFEQIGKWIGETIVSFLRFYADAASMLGKMRETWNNTWDNIKSFVMSIVSQISNAVNGAISYVMSLISRLKEALGLQAKVGSGSGGGDMPRARDGLQMRVPGAGAVDSRVFSARVSPGETVRITTPAQERAMMDGLPAFRNGGIGVQGSVGGSVVPGLLTAILGELRGIRAALSGGVSRGGTGGGVSGSAGASGGGGSVVGFNIGDLFSGGGTGFGTGTGSGTPAGGLAATDPLQLLLSRALASEGSISPNYDRTWKSTGSLRRIDDLNYAIVYAPQDTSNAGLLAQYWDNKAAIFSEYASEAKSRNVITPDVANQITGLSRILAGYGEDSVNRGYVNLINGRKAFTDIVDYATNNTNTYPFAQAALGQMSGLLSGGVVTVGGSWNTPNPSHRADGGLFADGMGQFTGLGGGPKQFAFRDGGDLRVPGAGAVDSQLVSFYATPGETVAIRTPYQQSEEANREEGRGDIIINGPLMAVYANDADSLRRSQDQIAMQLKQTLERVR